MIDPKYGSVLGQICHIKGEKPEAPRHDKKQTNAERHGFGNLILMCGPHHKIIDDHWKEFTVAKDGESCRRMTVRFGGMTLAAEAWYRDDPSVTRLPLGKPVYNARIPVPAGTASLRRVE